MKTEWRQKADSWHDWGLCELYDLLQECEWPSGRVVSLSEPDAAGFTLEGDITPLEFGAAVHRQMSADARWNELHPRFEEGKKITRCAPKVENGRRVTGEKCDPKVTKAEWEANACRGNPPQNARNKCQRMSSVPLTPKALEALLLPDGGAASFQEIAVFAVTPDKVADVSQGANPVAAKHHSNGKLRGPSASNSAREESSAFLLPCFLASVSAWKPFVKDPTGDCTLFLPDNVPFDRALRLWKHLRYHALVHPDEPGGAMYRNLPYQGDGEEAQLLVLLDSLQSHLAPMRSADTLDEDDIRELNDWVAINFSSGTNVNVGVVHRIEVPGSLFALLEPIASPHYWKEATQLSFVADCLSGVRVENVPMQTHIARALFRPQPATTWHDLESAAFLLYKNTDQAGKSTRRAVRLLPHFFHFFATRMLSMNEDQLSACRKIGELAGNAFCRDVTLLSRFHNCANPDNLRENLELFAFRLMKASNSDDRAGLWHVSPKEFGAVLELAASPQWEAASQTISLFASLAAFNKNLGETKPQG